MIDARRIAGLVEAETENFETTNEAYNIALGRLELAKELADEIAKQPTPKDEQKPIAPAGYSEEECDTMLAIYEEMLDRTGKTVTPNTIDDWFANNGRAAAREAARELTRPFEAVWNELREDERDICAWDFEIIGWLIDLTDFREETPIPPKHDEAVAHVRAGIIKKVGEMRS